MKKFVLIFRMDITNKEAQPTKEQMESYMQQWRDWINEIADNNQLANGGNHLSRHGRLLKRDFYAGLGQKADRNLKQALLQGLPGSGTAILEHLPRWGFCPQKTVTGGDTA